MRLGRDILARKAEAVAHPQEAFSISDCLTAVAVAAASMGVVVGLVIGYAIGKSGNLF